MMILEQVINQGGTWVAEKHMDTEEVLATGRVMVQAMAMEREGIHEDVPAVKPATFPGMDAAS